MAAKRRHVDGMPDGTADVTIRRTSEASSTAVGSPVADRRASLENYPRKRVAVACDFCRLRKTKCDAVKPSCSFCTESEVECRYRGSNADKSKDAAPSAAVVAQLEKRLANVEAKLRFSVENGAYTSILSPVSPLNEGPHQQHSNPSYSPDAFNNVPPATNYGLHSTPTPFVSPSFRQTQSEAMTARPSFLTFCCPLFVDGESWDDTEVFYDDEIAAGEHLHSQVMASLQQVPDLSRKTTRQLQQNFVQHFLRFFPIFDLPACIGHVDEAFACNFAPSSVSSCISMLIFAIGAISDERNGALGVDLPGFEYLARGNQMLEGFLLKTGSLTVLQCRILQTAYYQFAVRPLQAWNSIVQASRDCMHMLSSSKRKKLDNAGRDILHRVFWACSIIHHELEAVLKMHPIGLRQFHDIVPLPLCEEEEIGFYYFLAQASLRQILTETLDVVGYHTGTVIHAPIVTHEIHSQLKEWYLHLPPAVRFPLDASPLFDIRKSFLRSQYTALFIVVRWESVLRVLERGDAPLADLNEEFVRVRSEAKECIESCVLCLASAEELLMGRTLATQFVLWSSYAALTALILTWRVPAMAFIPATRDARHVLTGYELLRAWEHLPLVRRGLMRARSLMVRAKMPFEVG